MSSGRALGQLKRILPHKYGKSQTSVEQPVYALVSVDLHFVYVTSGQWKTASPPRSLDKWAQLKDTVRVPLLRDGSITLQRDEADPRVFYLLRDIDGDGEPDGEYIFKALSQHACESWFNALRAKTVPWATLFPPQGSLRDPIPADSALRDMWQTVSEDTIGKLRELPEVDNIDEYECSKAASLVQVLSENVNFEAAADVFGVFEDVLAWAPIVGVAVNVLGLGIGILARAARVRQNRSRVAEARLDVEDIARQVIDDLLRCVTAGGAQYRRFKVIAQIMSGVEDVVRELDRYELSGTVNRFRKANVPEEALQTLSTLRASAAELSSNIDVDTLSVRVDATLAQIHTLSSKMDEAISSLEKVGTMLDRGLNLSNDPSVVDSITAGIVQQLLPAIDDHLRAQQIIGYPDNDSISEGTATGNTPTGRGQRFGMENRRLPIPPDPVWKGGLHSVPWLDSRTVYDLSPNSGTTEAKLKAMLIKQDQHNSAAAGLRRHTTPVGCHGPPGSGKTIALLTVANDRDMQARFTDGIFFVRLSHQFTLDGRDIILVWAKILASAVGEAEADRLRSMSNLEDAFNAMKTWFSGRHALIIVDNVWCVVRRGDQDRREEWLWRFVHIAGDTNCVAFSTRDKSVVAQANGHMIGVTAMEAQSPRANRIFDKWSGRQAADEDPDNSRLRKKLLDLCNGLPLSIAIAAAAVRNSLYDYTLVIAKFRDTSIFDELPPDASSNSDGSVFKAISVSLEVLKRTNDVYVERFLRLAIFRRRARVPLTTLAMLWKVNRLEARRTCKEFAGLALAYVSSQKSTGEYRMELHDSHVMFVRHHAKMRAIETRNVSVDMALAVYHREFLQSVADARDLRDRRAISMSSLEDPVEHSNGQDHGATASTASASGESLSLAQPQIESEASIGRVRWWEVEDDYMLNNVVRHLVYAGWRGAAEELLSNILWLQTRILVSGVAKGARDDFDILSKKVRQVTPTSSGGYLSRTQSPTLSPPDAAFWDEAIDSGPPSEASARNARAFKLIKRALISATPALIVDPHQLPFQMVGRLTALAGEHSVGLHADTPASKLVQSARRYVIPPYFIPAWQTFNPPTDPLETVLETYLSGLGQVRVNAVSASPAGHLIAIAMEQGIAIFDWDSTRVVDCFVVEESLKVSDVAWITGQYVVASASDSNAYVYMVDAREHAGPTAPSKSVTTHNFSRGPISVLHGHSGPITCIAVKPETESSESGALSDPLDRLVATGSRDDTARMFHAQTGQQHRNTLKGHTGAITDICWVSRGQGTYQILTSSRDRTIRLFDIGGRTIQTFHGHRGPVTALALLPQSGREFLSASTDGRILRWTLPRVFEHRRRPKEYIGHHHAVTALTALPNGTGFVSASGEVGRLRVWDLKNDRNYAIDRAHEHQVTFLSHAKRPEGARILSSSADGTVRIWDFNTRERRKTMRQHAFANAIDSFAKVQLPESRETVYVTCSAAGMVCMFNDDSTALLAAAELLSGEDGIGRTDSSRRPSLDGTVANPNADAWESTGGAVAVAALSNGRFVTGGRDGRLWTWRASKTADGSYRLVRQDACYNVGSVVEDVVRLSDSDVAAASEQGDIVLWNLNDTAGVRSYSVRDSGAESSGEAVSCTALCPMADSAHVVAGCSDGSIIVLNWEQVEAVGPRLSLPPTRTASILDVTIVEVPGSRCSRLAALYSDMRVRVWRQNDGKDMSSGFTHITSLFGHTECRYGFVMGIPHTRWIVTGASDNSLRLWDIGIDNEVEGNLVEPVGTVSSFQRRSSPRTDAPSLYKTPVSADARLGQSVLLADLGADARCIELVEEQARSMATLVIGMSNGVLTKIELALPTA